MGEIGYITNYMDYTIQELEDKYESKLDTFISYISEEQNSYFTIALKQNRNVKKIEEEFETKFKTQFETVFEIFRQYTKDYENITNQLYDVFQKLQDKYIEIIHKIKEIQVKLIDDNFIREEIKEENILTLEQYYNEYDILIKKCFHDINKTTRDMRRLFNQINRHLDKINKILLYTTGEGALVAGGKKQKNAKSKKVKKSKKLKKLKKIHKTKSKKKLEQHLNYATKVNYISEIKKLGKRKDCPIKIKKILENIKKIDLEIKESKKKYSEFKKENKEILKELNNLRSITWKGRRKIRALESQLLGYVTLNPIYIIKK